MVTSRDYIRNRLGGGGRMSKVFVCPKCKGRGKVHDMYDAFWSLGLSYLIECIDNETMDDCPRCGGSGFIKFD